MDSSTIFEEETVKCLGHLFLEALLAGAKWQVEVPAGVLHDRQGASSNRSSGS